MLEAAEADIEFAQQRFLVKGTDRGVGLFEVAAAAVGGGVPPDLRGALMGISDETMSIPSFCQTPRVLSNLEAWIRRRLRLYLWRQWQNGSNRFKELRRRGVPKFQAAVAA